MANSSAADDFDRLGRATLETFVPAILLALASALTLGLLAAVGGSLPLAGFVLFGLFFWFHGVFIAAIAWKQLKPARPLLRTVRSPGLPAGAILALPILAFALLDAWGSAYFCAEGRAHDLNAVPDLPWLWIGWACFVLTALPARAVGLVIGEQPPLVPLWRRALLALPFTPVLWFLGYFFEWPAPVNCSPPFDNPGWGLFEGGMVLLPLLGLFLFVESYSLALLAGASVDQPAPAANDGSG